jgi:dTDP-4-amino-4,6-dideoxygalactose transaminase
MKYAPGSFPVAEQVAGEIVSLPMFPHLSLQQQTRVVAEIEAFSSSASMNQSGSGDRVLAAAVKTS